MCSRRTLTVPAAPKQRGSIDNANDDLIVSEGDVFISSIGVRCVFWKMYILKLDFPFLQEHSVDFLCLGKSLRLTEENDMQVSRA